MPFSSAARATEGAPGRFGFRCRESVEQTVHLADEHGVEDFVVRVLVDVEQELTV